MKTTATIASLMLAISVSLNGIAQTPCIYLAEDISPGAAMGNPTQFTEYDGNIYFAANDGTAGTELWMWDGTDATLVEDIRPGFFSSNPAGFYVWSGDLYFSANDGTNGTELFVYDGSTVSLAADINPGPFHSFPTNMIAFPGGIYFRADDGTNGPELYRYDGSTATLIADILPGPGGSSIGEFEVFGAELCFTATNGTNGTELWAYDGTSTTMLMDINPGFSGSQLADLRDFDGELVFRADDGATGMELWAYDGTSVYQIMDINPGVSNGNPWYLTESGGYLYFRALDGVWGMELWRYDGTGLPYLLEDIMVGGPHPISGAPSYLTDVDGYLVFQANNGTDGYELYRHDHTSYTYYDINPGPGDSDPLNYIGNGTDVFFTANDGVTGVEIYRWDGSDGAGLTLGADLFPGSTGSNPNNLFYNAPNDIIFNADDGAVGNELWDWPFDVDLTSEIDVLSCGDYTAPSGTVYTTPGSYTVMDTIPATTYPLCDSIITINLSIENDDPSFSYSTTDFCTNDIDEVPTTVTGGGTFSIEPAGMVYSTSTGELYFNVSTPGTYTIEYVTGGACSDSSEITINLVAANDASYTYTSNIYCISDDDPIPLGVVTPGGAWSSTPPGLSINPTTGVVDMSGSVEGVYVIKHVTTGVCPDSMEWNMEIIDMTTSVSLSGNVFTAAETGAEYQWMKCDSTFGLLPIWEAVSNPYIPPTDGCYAVELTIGTCIDTSACECLIYYGLEENQLPLNVELFPNPLSDQLQVSLDQHLDAQLFITDEIGRVVHHELFSGTEASIDLAHLASGVYLFMLTNEDGAFIEQIVKQ